MIVLSNSIISKPYHWLFSAIILAYLTYYAQANKSEFTYTLDDGYPIGEKLFGNIAGVDVDKSGNVIIFHRGSHRWGPTTFDANDVYLPSREAPIPEETVVTIDPTKKRIIRAWGRDLFYMPHGLSLDLAGGAVWLTDVALHQVFKYSIDGASKLIELGTAFIPGSDDGHFCKPTSVADTGDYVFVADGYCNSRVAMFSAAGKYLGEFGQSPDAYLASSTSVQPTFNIPHKITYAKEAKMLCVADRENGRIQCFSFEPRQQPKSELGSDENGLILNGAIRSKFNIADPLFNGRLFSLDYSPIHGGILVAVSGEDLYNPKKTPLGFVYNVTTGQLISRFAPPAGRTFGMAHDLAITGEEADSLYVVDISPVHLWKFSRPVPMSHKSSRSTDLEGGVGQVANGGLTRALSLTKDHTFSPFWYIIFFTVIGSVVFVLTRNRRNIKYTGPSSFSNLYSTGYPTSINSLFGGNRFPRRANGHGPAANSTMFSRRAFFSLFERGRQPQNEFNRIPMEESDISDDDKSDSDVEEFNINQTSPSVKINV